MTGAIPPGFFLLLELLGGMPDEADIANLLGNKRPSPPRRNRGRRTGRVALPKRKRKVSAYQREFGRQLKKLKRKHPRTPVTKLMKKAHAATRKARRGK